jgi:hypothetical protein
VTLAVAADRSDVALRRLSRGPRGGGWGAAGEGRRRGGEDECESQLGTFARTAIHKMPEQARRACYVSALLALAFLPLPPELLDGIIFLTRTSSLLPSDREKERAPGHSQYPDCPHNCECRSQGPSLRFSFHASPASPI